jgi:hypothetical protein
MQARYIALAVTAALASTAVCADSSNIELYGQANVTVGSYDGSVYAIDAMDPECDGWRSFHAGRIR